jgi:hypothetical protein
MSSLGIWMFSKQNIFTVSAWYQQAFSAISIQNLFYLSSKNYLENKTEINFFFKRAAEQLFVEVSFQQNEPSFDESNRTYSRHTRDIWKRKIGYSDKFMMIIDCITISNFLAFKSYASGRHEKKIVLFTA